MKVKLILLSILLVGCSSQPIPLSSSTQDWRDFGQQQAQMGWLKQSQSALAKQRSDSVLDSELYLAYDSGYEVGRNNYCQQDARMLGVVGKPYLGICDQLDPFFYQDYMSGRTSSAGSGI
ncbi:DUF2799 domain-containing protein [Vibrio sinaloensis]|uniref:DUF2799 domain-containing protein n=1 Tax=Photobacterium sp. (strain ATCC 43367) TaxID=379097 RepID=UPI002058D14A|nr:DUF2799 domain-containing protein [Vibrio sinaloensis]UPQ88273.1 DUF2799 domain-containing protein [Vibrio sinaloensis]